MTVELDGGRGEGGGQILRTALALSILTRRPMRMHRIRAGRAKPGLRRQHLACVEAAARLSGARTVGASVGSQELAFEPGETTADAHLEIDIGSAGSTSLVVQTILLPAVLLGGARTFTVHGGTHNPMAPPFDFLDRVFVPHLRAMGADVELVLDRHGFATGGASQASHDDPSPHRGRLTVRVGGASALRPIELLELGPIRRRRAVATIARLPTHVAERELGRVRDRLGFAREDCETLELSHPGTANVLTIEVEHASGRELVTTFGERGLRAELVADRACDEMAAFLGANVPVGEHLADQLLLPLALAGGGAFRCAPLSPHATTNIDTIRMFLDVPIAVEEREHERDSIVRVG
ncbi:MAG: RNA 3'-terminal phosphate cyclase [Deltaproteobacteria bacterium]|nr:RNA 3'-terminal phosphate cyclase [Deltaproteobacteria bacterium]